MDQGNRVGRLSGCGVTGFVWQDGYGESALVMGGAGRLRSFSGDNRCVVALGPRASATFLSNLHAAAMAQLAGEGRVYHRGLHNRARGALRCDSGWIGVDSVVADDCRDSVVVGHGSLHGLPVCAGEGARSMAEPVLAAAPLFSGGVAGVGSVGALRGVSSPPDPEQRDNVRN